jgi:mono/diheme cytochrome c family protein
MKNKWIGVTLWGVLLICLVGLTSACSSPTPTATAVPPTAAAMPPITPCPAATAVSATPSQTTPLPAAAVTSAAPSDDAALMEAQCVGCHGLDRVTSSHKTRDQWLQTITRMVKL